MSEEIKPKRRGRPRKNPSPVEASPVEASPVEASPVEASPVEIETGFDLPIICPIPTDPACGDKTPEVIQWWKDNHPAEYARRYSSRTHPRPHDTVKLPPHVDQEDETLDDESTAKTVHVEKN